MRSIFLFFGVFMLLTVSCTVEFAPSGKTNFTTNKLIGTWQLSETYISPGGVTEWMVVENGFIYVFETNTTYRKTAADGALQEEGSYRITDDELFLEFEEEGEQTTLGFLLEQDDNTITLSPSFPSICIEGCLYRFERR